MCRQHATQVARNPGAHLFIVVDNVEEVVELDGGLEAEHGLAFHRRARCAVEWKLPLPLF